MDHIRRDAAQEYHARSQQVQIQTAFSERRDKSRPDLQTDGIDKEYQTQILGERFHQRIQRHAEMAARDRAEQDPRHAEGHALEFQFGAEENADRDREREYKNRMRDSCSEK